MGFDGLYTRSCDAGYSYEFDVASAIVPQTVTVDASSATTWRLAVIRHERPVAGRGQGETE